mgnify:CR=1 FL=1
MDEHYAFFDLYGVDWDARRALSPTGAPTLTDADLFALLGQALEGLDDGHIQIGAAGPDQRNFCRACHFRHINARAHPKPNRWRRKPEKAPGSRESCFEQRILRATGR